MSECDGASSRFQLLEFFKKYSSQEFSKLRHFTIPTFSVILSISDNAICVDIQEPKKLIFTLEQCNTRYCNYDVITIIRKDTDNAERSQYTSARGNNDRIIKSIIHPLF